MAENILTPNAIWQGIEIPDNVEYEVVSKTIDGEYTISHILVNANKTNDGQVKVYCELCEKNDKSNSSAVLLVKGEDTINNTDLVKALADEYGYVLSVDLKGEREGVRFYTEFPESLFYANYDENVVNVCAIEGDATDTCWFVWALALRYCAKFLINFTGVKKLGGIGFGDFATPLWQTASMTDDFDCVVFGFNAGWKSFLSYPKFHGEVQPKFSDAEFVFSAGIEPQAYAIHLNCPTMVLSPTNSQKNNVDRVYDTISLIDEKVFSVVNYSVGARDVLDGQEFTNIKLFFDKFLLNKDVVLSDEISILYDDDTNSIVVKPSLKTIEDIKSVTLYYSENTFEPGLRVWEKLSNTVNSKKGTFKFQYNRKDNVNFTYFFAKITYNNGFTISSNIIYKEYPNANQTVKSNILYSSINAGSENLFYPAVENAINLSSIDLKSESVSIKTGAYSLSGISCSNGLLTFAICTDKFRPQNNSVLIFDIYTKTKGLVTVSLIVDYFGERVEYFAQQEIIDENAWSNVKFSQGSFKSRDGKQLVDFSEVQAISFNFDKISNNEFIINNVLWI